MPILNLDQAKRATSEQWPAKRGKRSMSPENTPAVLLGANGFAGSGGFAAAKINRLTGDFLTSQRAADQDLFGDNIRLRTRARKLAVDNPFARKFLQMVVQNVVGAHGVLMRPKVLGINGKETAQTKLANERISEEWKRWCKKGRCTADGRMDFPRVQQLVVKNVAREGENLTKDVYGRQFNDCAYALQLLDNDQLDDTMMQSVSENVTIRMGVEVNEYRRPLAYHLFNGHPYDIFPGTRTRTRVPAEFVTHTAVWERPSQTRGYTWMSASILPLNQYGRYEEAVVVASRFSAAKVAVIEKQYPEGWGPEDEDLEGDDTNSDGTNLMTGNSGEIDELDYGEKLNFIDPRFPTNTHKDFTQTMLRNVASGLLVQYPSLANDLEGVNFSSIRAGLVDERDMWRVLQAWFIVDFLEPIYLKWLKMALLTTLKDIQVTPAQMEMVQWRPRGWDWVDPQKDANTVVLKLGNGMSTYGKELGAQGLDFEDTMDERAREQKYIEDLQERFDLRLPVVLGTDLAGDQAGKGVAAGDASQAAEVDGSKGGDSGGSNGGAAKGKGK